MNSTMRRNEIIRILSQKKSVSVEELASFFKVSNVTIRTDLDDLAKKGLLMRTHGGAIYSEVAIKIRLSSNTVNEAAHQKDKICEKAATFIQDGESIIIDNGSTAFRVARHIGHKNITTYTGSVLAINELINEDSVELIILSGLLRKNSLGAIGPLTNVCLNQIHANWLFLGASAVAKDLGILSSNLVEAETKRNMVKCVDKVCLLVDSSKFSSNASGGKVCFWDEIDYLVTDSISNEDRTAIEEYGVKVIIVE
ncbi:MAG: DeoR/GlpR transcriptional regulator [Sphaerochaetaceae bacterium]|nr:DeoR/GlpR transcriptional regulator [Sphaerochaetaceae bacterium]